MGKEILRIIASFIVGLISLIFGAYATNAIGYTYNLSHLGIIGICCIFMTLTFLPTFLYQLKFPNLIGKKFLYFKAILLNPGSLWILSLFNRYASGQEMVSNLFPELQSHIFSLAFTVVMFIVSILILKNRIARVAQ